jgi:hypothetical protein
MAAVAAALLVLYSSAVLPCSAVLQQQSRVCTVSSATCQCSVSLLGELLLLMLSSFNIEPDKVPLLHITMGAGYASLAGKGNGAKATEGFGRMAQGATKDELTYSQEEAVTAAQAEASTRGTFTLIVPLDAVSKHSQ